MYAVGMGTPRIDSLKFVNYTIIENAHIVRKKLFLFILWVLYVQLLGDRTNAGFCVPL